MVLNQNRRPTPHPTVVLELAHQLFFLGVHADNRITAPAELLPVIGEIAQLLVSVGTAVGAKTLAVGVEGVVQFPQQTADRVRTDPQAQLGQLPTDGSQVLDRKSTRLNSSHVAISY